MRRLRLIASLVVFGGSLLAAARGATYTVDDDRPADFSSIQSAINAASNGDEIVVRRGRYRETLNFLNKSLTVRSESGASDTVIFLEGETRIVLLNGDSTLRGFTITGGRSRVGGGIRVSDSARPRIEANIIENNVAARDGSAFPAFGAGIEVEALSVPVITRNVIRGNRAEGDAQGLLAYGGGIDLADDASATITDNVIENNRAADSGGGISLGVAGSSTTVDITNNTIVGNEAGSGAPNAFSYGGGVLVDAGAQVALRNNLITNNVARFSGGGIYFFATGLQGITYTRNDFDGNVPDACGGLPLSKCNGGQLFLPPSFEDAATGRYRLRSDSAVLDQGILSGAPSTDADGLARSVDSDLDGAVAPDVGAFENQKEITRVRFNSRDSLVWDGSRNPAVMFEVYRDSIGALGAGPIGACFQGALATPAMTDASLPPPGGGYLYLVRGKGNVIGSLGYASSGSERTPVSACP